MDEASILSEAPYFVQGNFERKKNPGARIKHQKHRDDLHLASAPNQRHQAPGDKICALRQIRIHQLQNCIVGGLPVQPVGADVHENQDKWKEGEQGVGSNRKCVDVRLGGKQIVKAGEKLTKSP